MKTIQVPTKDQVDSTSQTIFDSLNQQLGMVPNLYATIGYSSNALESYLNFSQALTKGSFNAKERETIFLAVSEVNDCDYCKAAHTAIAKMNGFSEEDTLNIRMGSISDAKLSVLSRLAASIAKNAGKAEAEIVNEFFELGYSEKELIDVAALVVEITFTNYAARLTQIPVDFPEAKSLEEKAA